MSNNSIEYFCELCKYSTNIKGSYNQHLLTDKHKQAKKKIKLLNSPYKCSDCDKPFQARSGLWKHNKKCHSPEKNTGLDSEVIVNIIKQNTEFKELLMEQNKQNQKLQKQLIEVCKENSTVVTNNINTTNNNHKTFNLNFFLNETCKDAMNIMDFVNSLQIQLSDLESVGELGFVNGLSKLIIKGLNDLEENERPVHCSDLKRETMYVKDENKWEKEDTNNTKMKKALRRIAHKNSKMIPAWKEKHPDCRYSASHLSDQYNHIILESMGGSGDNDDEKAGKIISKIAKEVSINKI